MKKEKKKTIEKYRINRLHIKSHEKKKKTRKLFAESEAQQTIPDRPMRKIYYHNKHNCIL